MATDDVQRLVTGSSSAPCNFTIPGNGQIRPKALNAVYNGSGSSGNFVAVLEIVSDAGVVVSRTKSPQVLQGGSAEVTFAPFLGGATSSGASGIVVDDYVFKHANTTVTGIHHAAQNNLIIQGNPITLDGSTTVVVEFFAPIVEIFDGDQNQAIGFELWDGATDVGTIAFIEGGITGAGVTDWVFGNASYSRNIFTPAAGAHQFAIYAWRNDASGVCTVFASTFVDGTGSVGPCWYRVTTTGQMPTPLEAGLPPDMDLPDGYVVRFNALDPVTGASVTGVVVSAVSIFGTLLPSDSGSGGPFAGPYMLVPGPGA